MRALRQRVTRKRPARKKRAFIFVARVGVMSARTQLQRLKVAELRKRLSSLGLSIDGMFILCDVVYVRNV